MLRIHKSVKHTVQILKNATCTKSCKKIIRLIVSPAIQEEKTASAMNNLIQDEGKTLSKDAQKRLWNLFNNEDYIKKTKTLCNALPRMGDIYMTAPGSASLKILGPLNRRSPPSQVVLYQTSVFLCFFSNKMVEVSSVTVPLTSVA